jgi:hypothetical protein
MAKPLPVLIEVSKYTPAAQIGNKRHCPFGISLI